MKRRNFLRMLPVGFLAARFAPVLDFVVVQPKTNYELFMDSFIDELCAIQGIPRKILDMELSREWSLSREVLINRFYHPTATQQ